MVRSRWYGLRVRRIIRITQHRAPLHPHNFCRPTKASGRTVPIRGGCKVAVAEQQQGCASGQATLDGVIVAATLTVVLVSVTGGGVTVALRIAGVVRVLDVLGVLLDLVVRRGQ